MLLTEAVAVTPNNSASAAILNPFEYGMPCNSPSLVANDTSNKLSLMLSGISSMSIRSKKSTFKSDLRNLNYMQKFPYKERFSVPLKNWIISVRYRFWTRALTNESARSTVARPKNEISARPI